MTWDAILPIVTLILGYLGSLYTESRRDRRDHARRITETIATVERGALLEIQQRLTDTTLLLLRWESDPVGLRSRRPPAPADAHESLYRLIMLRSRIIDDDLRAQVAAATDALIYQTMDKADGNDGPYGAEDMPDANEAAERINGAIEAIGRRIRSLGSSG
jgi:hypothetical protein